MMSEINQAVILAGGMGKRLMPLTKNIPKPMVKIYNKPFLKYLIEYLQKQNIKKILILTGYKSKVIENYFKNKKNITVFKTRIKDDTGSRLLKAYKKKLLENHFFLLYSDNYCELDYNTIRKNYFRKNKKILMTVHTNNIFKGEYGLNNNVLYDKKTYLVKNYNFKYNLKPENAIDIGVFVINQEIFKRFKNFNINKSFQKDILKLFINRRHVTAYPSSKKYFYITSRDSLNVFSSFIKRRN